MPDNIEAETDGISPDRTTLALLREISASYETIGQQVHQPLVFDAFFNLLANQIQEIMRAQICTLSLLSPSDRSLRATSASKYTIEEMAYRLTAEVQLPLDTVERPQHLVLQVTIGYMHKNEIQNETLQALLKIYAQQIALIISLQQQSSLLLNESFVQELFIRLLQDPYQTQEWLSRDVPLLDMDLDLHKQQVFMVADVVRMEKKRLQEAVDALLDWRLRYLAENLYKEYPGSLLCYQRPPYYLIGLISIPEGGSKELRRWLLPHVLSLHREVGLKRQIRIGIGGVASLANPHSFQESFEQARIALEFALSHQDQAEVQCYSSELRKADDALISQQEVALDYPGLVESIATYDRKNAPDLLQTLEIFLKCGMSATEAARVLQIPHVSMRRRLERLQKLCNPYQLDLSKDPYLWFDGLYSAIKSYKDAHSQPGIIERRTSHL